MWWCFTSIPRISTFANYNDGAQQWLKGDLQDCGNSSFQFAQGYESPPITCTPCMGTSQMASTMVKTQVSRKMADFSGFFFSFPGPEASQLYKRRSSDSGETF